MNNPELSKYGSGFSVCISEYIICIVNKISGQAIKNGKHSLFVEEHERQTTNINDAIVLCLAENWFAFSIELNKKIDNIEAANAMIVRIAGAICNEHTTKLYNGTLLFDICNVLGILQNVGIQAIIASNTTTANCAG